MMCFAIPYNENNKEKILKELAEKGIEPVNIDNKFIQVNLTKFRNTYANESIVFDSVVNTLYGSEL